MYCNCKVINLSPRFAAAECIIEREREGDVWGGLWNWAKRDAKRRDHWEDRGT